MHANQLADLCDAAGVEIGEYYDQHDARIYFSVEISNCDDGLFSAVGALFTEAAKVDMTNQLSEVFRNAKLHNPHAKANQHNYIVFALDWPF